MDRLGAGLVMALRRTRRGGSGKKAYDDRHFPKGVWTGYADGVRFVPLSAPDKITLARTGEQYARVVLSS